MYREALCSLRHLGPVSYTHLDVYKRQMMGSTVQKVPAAKPSANKFVDYKGVNKLPMQGGAFTPK